MHIKLHVTDSLKIKFMKQLFQCFSNSFDWDSQ